jgi:uncharacterized protein YdbL (DUF1318 family)
MKTRTAALPFLVLAALVAACVTVNVYFPEAAVKDLSQQIEQEVQKQAAEEKSGEPAKPSEEPATPPAEESEGQSSLLDLVLGVSPAYAQSVPAPEVSNPAIRKIIDSRAARLPDVEKYKSMGVIGENKDGLLEIIKLDAVSDLRQRADVQRVVKAENSDREQLYKEVATAENVDLSQLPKIRATYAETLRQNARKGEWIQLPSGEWKQK